MISVKIHIIGVCAKLKLDISSKNIPALLTDFLDEKALEQL